MAFVLIITPVFDTLLIRFVGLYPGIFLSKFSQLVSDNGVPLSDFFDQALNITNVDDINLHFTLKFYDPLICIGLVWFGLV